MRRIRFGAPLVPREPPFRVRIDEAAGGHFAQVWFVTGGCNWDRSGACTMCNYGHGPVASSKAMVDAVAQALSALPSRVDELLVSPSGSMLDPAEVPPAARSSIYGWMRHSGVPKVCIESRPETVTLGATGQLAASFPRQDVAVEIGLESSSPWVQKYCVNKGADPKSFERAASVLRKRGVRTYANVCLGVAFLSPQEAIDDARKSIEWALAHGADIAVLFPMHVKSHTLLEWLHRRGQYRPPSLWSVVEVLARLNGCLLPRVTLSWYRANFGDPHVLESPTTCKACAPTVLGLLDVFRANPSMEALAPLVAANCECKRRWQSELATGYGEPLGERVLMQYDALAADHGLQEWWAQNRAVTRRGLLEPAG